MMSTSVELIKFNESIITELELLNAPLKRNFGIFLFTYRRLNKDGTLLHLTTQKNWIEQSIQKNLLVSSEIAPKIIQTINASKKSFLWSGNLKDSLYNCLYEFNIWNGITFYQNYEDYVEIVAFATTKNNSEALNFYVNNLELLDHFKTYFKEKISHILSSKDFRKLHIDIQDKIPLLQPGKDVKKQYLDFFNDTKVARYYFSGKYKDVYLTHREADVLFYLSQGKSSKNIAKILRNHVDFHAISHRTVESYWNSIKSKFQIFDKAKIIDIFLESNIYNEISYVNRVFRYDD